MNIIFSMLQINKKYVSKQFPDITESLKSHDPKVEKLIRKWGNKALLKYLC